MKKKSVLRVGRKKTISLRESDLLRLLIACKARGTKVQEVLREYARTAEREGVRMPAEETIINDPYKRKRT